MRVFDWYDAGLICVALLMIVISVAQAASQNRVALEAMLISAILMFAIIYRIIASWV